MQHRRGVRLMVVSLAITATVAASMLTGMIHPQTAHACPVIAQAPACPNYVWPYGHSWYVTNYSTAYDHSNPTGVALLAKNDAAWVNYACVNNPPSPVDFMSVLDFGRPGKHNGSYSVFGFDGAWHSYSVVQQLAENYAQEWYADTTTCPTLHLVIGTANDYECQGSDTDCNVYTAGQQFDTLVHNVETYLKNLSWDWQITAWVGDDLEAEWDQWSTTINFINGVYNQEGAYSWKAFLMDFGDANIDFADIQGNHWTYQNVYDASWGIGYDWPLPEIYWHTSSPGNINQWVNMYTSSSVNRYAGQVTFEGTIAECTEADTLSTGNCWTGNGRCEYSPEYGRNLLAADVNQSNISHTTNIQWEGHSQTGNNGC